MSEQPEHDRPEAEADLPRWLHDMTATGEDHASVQRRVSTFGIVAVLLIAALLGVIGYALYQRNQSQPTEGPAPDFSVTAFDLARLDRPGERITLDSLKGQAVVINFWASYCAPCRDEAPMLERVWRDYRDQGVVMLGINTDDIESDALAYMDEYDITFPNAPDQGGRVEDDYRITGIPETFVIDRDGEIVRHFIATPRESDLRTVIERALDS
ncbi:MAG: TlpA family protein disulfide reductase [Anaerolineae bacterium]|nr:TlpA family protein disulfide reductase [Anaerolineae bacterium]